MTQNEQLNKINQVEIESTPKFEIQDTQIETPPISSHEKLRTLQEEAEQVANHEIQADLFLTKVEQLVKSLKEQIFDNKEPSENNPEGFINLALEQVAPDLVQKNNNSKPQEEFTQWLNEKVLNNHSWLFKQMTTWSHKENIVNTILNTKKQLDVLNMNEAITKLGVTNIVANRFNDILESVDQVLNQPIYSNRFPKENILAQFLIEKANEKTQKKNNTFLGKLLKTTPKKEFSDITLKYLKADERETGPEELMPHDKIWNHIKKDKKGNISLLRDYSGNENDSIMLANIRKSFENIRANSEETPKNEIPEITGLSEFAKAAEINEPAFRNILEKLQQMISNKSLISSIELHPNIHPTNPEFAGLYYPENASIEIYIPKELFTLTPQERILKICLTLLHEVGHAIDPEVNLPIHEALSHSIVLEKLIKQEQPTSLYSRIAQTYYHNAAKPTLGISSESKKKEMMSFIEDSTHVEEWAEMFAYSIVLPELTTNTTPLKNEFIKHTLHALGMDTNTISSAIDQSITQPN